MARGQFGIPEIYEHEAKPKLQLLYRDIKFVLKVPIVNFIFRTLAHYDKFLEMGWQQVRPNMLTTNIETGAKALRYPNTSFRVPAMNWGNVYDQEALETLEKIIFTFNYVNTKLLLIVTAWEESLGYRSIRGNAAIQGFIQPGIIKGLPEIQLIKIPFAPFSTQALLMEVIQKKHSYDAASDYRALAFYPKFLEITWSGLKKYIGSKEYVLLHSVLKEKAREIVHRDMPYPVTITPQNLSLFYNSKDIAGIMGVITMFSGFITDLVIDGEIIRQSLHSKA